MPTVEDKIWYQLTKRKATQSWQNNWLLLIISSDKRTKTQYLAQAVLTVQDLKGTLVSHNRKTLSQTALQ
jgi:hypothetical protein